MAWLPTPRLEQLDNRTGLTHFHYMKMAPGREFCDVVAVKASFELTPGGIAREPRPGMLCLADTHRDPAQPQSSSLTEASDVILGKPAADIYVTGSARTARPAKRWSVGVGLGPVDKPLAAYECIATGPRVWRHSLLKGWNMGEPEATQAVPVQYELAYGGRKPHPQKPSTEWDGFDANPSGSGYSFDAYSTSDTPPAPQWESAGVLSPINSAELVGLGPVARFWASRVALAGTYDEAWQRQRVEQHPVVDFPADFDMRFFLCAHPQLQTAAPLRGDEALRLHGLLEGKAHLQTWLPGWAVMATWQAPEADRTQALPLDTVHIDLDARQVHLVWHMRLPHALGVDNIQLNLEKL